MADVFISYKRSERDRVKVLARALQSAELTVWFDDKLHIGASEGFDDEIERELAGAHAVLVCWSPEAMRALYVRAEAKKGLLKQKLVPIFIESCDLPVPFNELHTVDLTRWVGDSSDPDWKQVVGRLNELRSYDPVRKAVDEWKALKSRLPDGILSWIVANKYTPSVREPGVNPRIYNYLQRPDDIIAALTFAEQELRAVRMCLDDLTAREQEEGYRSHSWKDAADSYREEFLPKRATIEALAHQVVHLLERPK